MNTTRKQRTIDLAVDELIVVNGLSLYGVELADLRVLRGEVVALVGPNGSGKSSVSQVLVGLLPAATGSARVLGLDPMDDEAALKGRLGFLVRDLETMGSLTSRDVLDICAAVRDCTTAYALELAGRLELDLDQPMSQLSRGQLRRLGVVQALMHRPDVIVLDDPTTELDEAGCRTLAVVLREVAARGAAVLVTAQSATDIEACTDRIATFTRHSIPAAAPSLAAEAAPDTLSVEPETRPIIAPDARCRLVPANAEVLRPAHGTSTPLEPEWISSGTSRSYRATRGGRGQRAHPGVGTMPSRGLPPSPAGEGRHHDPIHLEVWQPARRSRRWIAPTRQPPSSTPRSRGKAKSLVM